MSLDCTIIVWAEQTESISELRNWVFLGILTGIGPEVYDTVVLCEGRPTFHFVMRPSIARSIIGGGKPSLIAGKDFTYEILRLGLSIHYY